MPTARHHVVILAGGSGTRFWPWSRRSRPKPFVSLAGRRTLLGEAWRRARGLVPVSRIWIVVPSDLAAEARRAVPGLRADRLVREPMPRDTAAALVLACDRIAREDPGAVVLAQPSDHAVDPAAWRVAARRALGAARRGALVCLGVPPREPSTAYGYLVCDRLPNAAVAKVTRFVEKPVASRARALLRTGRCLWNAGVFAWRVDAFLAEAARQRPDIVAAARAAARGRPAPWRRLRPISVDHAILEGARDVRVVRLHGDWDDLGSWDVVARRAAVPPRRRALLVDSPRSVAFVRDRWVAILGVPDVVVVESPDAVLVLSRSRAQEVRRVVDALRRCGRADLE